MEYEKLRSEIESDIGKLAQKIEQFCVLENTEYTKLYKDKLRAIHNLFEELN